MVTNKKFERRNSTTGALTFTLDAASLDEKYSILLNKYSKELTVPGFRKGKAPLSVLEMKIGKDLRMESIFKCLDEALDEELKNLSDEESPLIGSTYEVEDEEKYKSYKGGEDLTFTVLYEIYPEIDLPEYKGLKFEIENVEVKDEDIQKRIDELLEQNSMIQDAGDKVAENGDVVDVNYVELDENGEKISSTSRDNFTYTLGSGYSFYKFDDDIIGMKRGETKVFNKKYAENDEDVSEEYRGKEVHLSLTLNSVKTKNKPALDNEFAEDVKEEYKSVDDLKNGIRKEMEEDIAPFLSNQKIEVILNKLVDSTSFDVPSTLLNINLEREWNMLVSQFGGLSEKEIEKYGIKKDVTLSSWEEPMKRELKKFLVLKEIIKKEKIEASDEEVDEKYGDNYKDESNEERKNGMRNDYRRRLVEEKADDILEKENTFTSSSTLSYYEFKNKRNEEVNE